jgi:hypothetical protein
MRMYWKYMNTYHISYAAYGTGNRKPGNDYIRGRRYMPAPDRERLRGTDLGGEVTRTGMFETGVPHRITIVKQGTTLFMHVENDEKALLCRLDGSRFPPITEGRIGLRHMYTRSARYKNFTVWRSAE